MPQRKSNRVHINLSDEAFARLKQLRRTYYCHSRSNAVRDAIELAYVVNTYLALGYTIKAHGEDNVEDIIGPFAPRALMGKALP